MYICDKEHRLAEQHTAVVERQETYPVRRVPITITTQVRVCLRCGADVYDRELDQRSLERCLRVRSFQRAPMPGQLIELRESPIDFRDYLDNTPIHNGDQIMLWVDDHWRWARYEVASFRDRAVLLESVDGTRQLDRERMRFRWPTQED